MSDLWNLLLFQAAEYRARCLGGSLQTGQQQHGRHDGGTDDDEGQPADRRRKSHTQLSISLSSD